MAQPVQVRPISNDEGNRLLRIVRRGTGSVVTWRRAQMVLLSAQHMPEAKIAEVTFMPGPVTGHLQVRWHAAHSPPSPCQLIAGQCAPHRRNDDRPQRQSRSGVAGARG
jgi:hypothetical protein